MQTTKQNNMQTLSGAGDYDEPVLVIIDMQPGFKASHDALTICAIENQIAAAKSQGLGILVVEYDAHDEGETHRQLMRHLEDYDRTFVVPKSTDDGSEEIFEATIENGLWPEHFIICGVNSDSCLLATVKGLIQRLPTCRITLPQDACNSDCSGKDGPVWQEDYAQMSNVVVQMHAC